MTTPTPRSQGAPSVIDKFSPMVLGTPQPTGNVIAALNAMIKKSIKPIQQAFLEADIGKIGALSKRQFVEFMKKTFPDVMPSDTDFLWGSLNMDDNASLTFKDFLRTAKESHQCTMDLKHRKKPAELAVKQLQEHMEKYTFDTKAAFDKLEAGGQGLEYYRAIKMITALVPKIQPTSRRYLLAKFKIICDSADGQVIQLEELLGGLEPAWRQRERAQVTAAGVEARKKTAHTYQMTQEKQRAENQKIRDREVWASGEREKLANEHRQRVAEDTTLRKSEAGMRLRLRDEIRLEAADIALTVKKDREIAHKDRQIMEQEINDRASLATLEYQRRMDYKLRLSARQAERDTEKHGMIHGALSHLQKEVLHKYKYRMSQKFVNVTEFISANNDVHYANDDDDDGGGGGMASSPNTPPPKKLLLRKQTEDMDDTRVWASVKVVDSDEPLPPSRYTPLPPTKRYSYYKHFGFAGRGAKTSWAHNPTKKPVLAAFQGPLSAACSSM